MKSSAMDRGSAHGRTPWSTMTIARVGLLMLLAFSSSSDAVSAQDPAMPADDAEQIKTVDTDTLSLWLKARFSEAEFARLKAEDLSLEAHYCSCSDRPKPHFPYAAVLLKTPRGDLVARPELREVSLGFTAIAVRSGDRYCAVESENDCYGSFADLCEFTDFRFGPSLAAFFPTCKSDEDEAASALPARALPASAEPPRR